MSTTNPDSANAWQCAECGKGWDGKGRAPCRHNKWKLGYDAAVKKAQSPRSHHAGEINPRKCSN